MDIDAPVASSATIGEGNEAEDAPTAIEPTGTSKQAKSATKNTLPRAPRTLRTRPSNPLPASNGTIRPPTDKELSLITYRLGPDGLQERKDELLLEKEEELRHVVDEHDTAVREKFHLERFVTMVTGWDPISAKNDNSPVFLDYKRNNHNLLNLAPPVNAIAGPSRARHSLPARATRQQIQEQAKVLLTPVVAPPAGPVVATGKGKGRASDIEVKVEETPKGKGKAKIERESMPPPSEPLRKKARASIAGEEIEVVRKKPGPKPRVSLPNLPIVKRGPGRPKAIVEDDPVETPVKKGPERPKILPKTEADTEESPIIPVKRGRPPKIKLIDPIPSSPIPIPQSPIPEVIEEPPTPVSAPLLPSLAHIPFPPPPIRSRPRRVGPNRIWYTDHLQLPQPSPPHNGNLNSLMTSYISLEDTGPQPELPALEARAAREGFIRNRVNWLQSQGRLLRLLDEQEVDDSGKVIAITKGFAKPSLVVRKQDHQDHLMSHMRQVRNAMLDEAKAKPIYCKRIARMIMAYWDHLSGREDREKLEQEREMKRRGREVIKGLRKKWGLAVKVIKAKVAEAQKAEQDRLGKEHLQNMLQRSTGLLEAQQTFEGGEHEEDSDDTDDVSSADDSDLGEGENQEPDDSGMEDLEKGDEEEMEVDEVEGVFGPEGDNLDTTSETGPPALGTTTGDSDADSESGAEEEEEETHSDSDTGSQLGTSALLTDSAQVPSPPAANPSGDLEQPLPTPGYPTSPNGHISTSTPTMANDLTKSSLISGASINPELSSSDPADDLTPPITPADPAPQVKVTSRRARKIVTPASLLQVVDPDADDIEFDGEKDDEEDEDVEMDIEMEEAEAGEKGDSEDEGLLADADIPIEELLKRYGVPPTTDDTSPASSQNNENDVIADQSLLDENLLEPISSDGKRQRRVRQVWTPEDNPPPLPKKPRVEVNSPEGTPESSSEEESSEEEEEEEEEEVEAAEGIEVEEDPNAPKTRVPFLLRGTLRPYQHAGLDWLAGLYANNMNGILADEMGLGKTIQTISLLAHLACDKGVWGQHLIIVPTSVILNWEMEFKKFLPGFKVLCYYGNQKERKEKRIGWLTEHSWQVCITSYQIVLADQHIFRRKSWQYMILDEAHNIKNFRSQRWQTLLGFKAQRRLLLTGTPLQNNLMELWSLLYFLMPHGVAEEATAVVGFANHRDFVEWFSNPMDKAVESGDVLDEQAMETVSKLHTLLRPFILRRLKSEVEKQLPGKFEHVVYCRLSKRQRFLYDEFMSRSSTKDALTNGGYLGVMNTLMQLRKVCNHPDLFEVRPVRTSFAMDRSVAADFTPMDILIRKRLLVERDGMIDVTGHEGMSGWTAFARKGLDASDRLPSGTARPLPPIDTRTSEGWLKYREAKEEEESMGRWRNLREVNKIRCRSGPIYGSTFLSMLSEIPRKLLPSNAQRHKRDLIHDLTPPCSDLILSLDDRRRLTLPLIDKFAVIPPTATARDLASLALPSLRPDSHPSLLDPEFDTLHHASTKLQIAFPDSSLLQYDCGKLQKLAEMLRDLKAGGHRCLIFTQMTRVLDILEIFLNYNGHRYLRLDGSTKIEDRQIITERFNSDDKIFCFIASSRSGGVGINLTGADTVFFYDSDWNPSMDRQCMDRAHRIGQTREVHIYRFVSSHTVEENMLKKANQKRLLDKVIIQEGDFTTEFFGKVDWRDTLYDGDQLKVVAEEEKDGVEDIEVEQEPEAEDVGENAPRRGEEREFAKMVAEVEDEEDVQAARVALGEGEMDMGDFEAAAEGKKEVEKKTVVFEVEEMEETMEEEEDGIGGVDEYMLRLVEWDWASFASYR